MKFTKKVLAFLGFILVFFAFFQKTNAFTLKMNGQYFDGTNILTGNWAEVQFTNVNSGYGAFFLGSGINTNVRLTFDDNWIIDCKKQLNGYYTMLFSNFLMLGLDEATATRIRTQNLTPDTTYNGRGLFYDCTKVSPNSLNINNKMRGLYGYVSRDYGSGGNMNRIEMWAGIKKINDHRELAGSSPLEVVYSETTGYTSKTMSGAFNISLINSGNQLLRGDIGHVYPREIGDIRINNAEKFESGVYVIPYENYQNPGIDISIVTSKPNISTNIAMVGQYEKHNSQTGEFSSPRYLTNLSSTVSSITIPNGHIPNENIAFTGAYGYYGYKNIKFKHSDYRHLSGTLTLNIGDWSRSIKFRVEGGDPCLNGRDNDYFITPDFWKMNQERGGPTKAQIKCAVFGYEDTKFNESNGAGYNTAYTKGWNNYTANTCTNVNVVTSGSLPNTLASNTIYVLTNTGVNLSNNLIIPKCTAIISKANVKPDTPGSIILVTHHGRDTTLNKPITINDDNVILDNISIKGNSFDINGITINGKKNITLNVVKVYNNNIGIALSNSNNIILNNIQSFNNNIGIQQDLNSNQIAINNSQIYRNNTGVIYDNSTNNIIYNSAIYQNKRGLDISNFSNNNTFNNIAAYSNKTTSGHEENIFIEKGLTNEGNNIEIQSRNDVPISDIENIRGYNRREKIQEPYEKRNYTCKGGTNGVCRINSTSGPNTKYYCTGAITESYTETTKSFSANGTFLEDNPRTLLISNENLVHFDIMINNSTIFNEDPEFSQEEPGATHLEFLGDIQMQRNVDGYIFQSTNGEINGTLTSGNYNIDGQTYTYDVSVTYSGITFTGYGNDEINYRIISGTKNDEFGVRDLMCQHDGGFQSRINGNATLYIGFTRIATPIFTTSSNLNQLSCSWANCFTNPKLSGGGYSFLTSWTNYYYGRSSLIDVTNYSYGIGLKRQKDVLLPGGIVGGKTKSTGESNGYYGGYFIGSTVPAQGIERSKINSPSKIHYEIGGRTTHGSFGNMINIISLTERGFPSSLNTIVSYQEGPWSTRPNQIREKTRSGRTNIYLGLSAGSRTTLYVRPGDTTHYPVVLQTYGNRYYATHRWMTRLARENIAVDLLPQKQCLPPEQEILETKRKWLTHENEGIAFNYEGHPLVGANVTGLKKDLNNEDNRNIKVRRDKTNGTITYFDNIDNETGAINMTITIPCTTGNICSTTLSIISPSRIQDILEFKSQSKSKTYQRDMKGPDIRISGTGAVECRDSTLRVKLKDSCIGTSGFMISGFFNTSWLRLETNNNRNADWYDIIIDSGTIGRTGKDANGQVLHKTGIIYAKDKYNNETTGLVDINMIDTPVTMSATGSTISTSLDLLNGERIEDHERSIGINVVEQYSVTEGDYCGIQDLYLTGFKCFNYNSPTELGRENRALTGNIAGHILTISPRLESEYFGYNSGIICKINIKDNEDNTVTGYMTFNINTVHKPLFEEPVIIGGTKYSEYSGTDYRNQTNENINIGKNNSYGNWKYLSGDYSKYTSGDSISIALGNSNAYTKKYHISCTDYYTGTENTRRTSIDQLSYPWTIYFSDIDDIENCGTGQISLKVSIWNGEDVYGTNIDQFTTGITDYVFYDSIPANTTNRGEYNGATEKLIITSGHTIDKQMIRVDDPENNAIDTRTNVPGYINNSVILNTGILDLILIGGTTLDTNMFARLGNDPLYPRSKNVTVTGTIINDTTYRVHEEQICLNIGTGLLRDFSKVWAGPNYTCTRYRYTSENPIYINNSKRGREGLPEHDISVLRVKVDSGVINTGLSFTLLTAKPINSIDDIECTGYSEKGWFRCTGISGDAQKINNEGIVCTKRNTGSAIPRCDDWALNEDQYNYHLSGSYPGDEHRRVQLSRKNTISYEVYSGEDNSGYYNQHTGEREFFGKISITNNNKIFNESYVVIELYEDKTPFKAGIKEYEKYWYGDLVSALEQGSGDNGFLFYISWPQKINHGNINSGVVGDISYEITFSDDVANEFYEITGESIVNKFKKTLFIKRPTFNFANPKGYLFNFPDYDGFNH